MFILDTNLLSPEKVAKHGSWLDGPLFTSSVSAQELLGMQRPGKETGYRYALPVLDEHGLGIRHGMDPDMLIRWAIDHSKRLPVAKRTDRLVIPRSRLRPESLELGHVAIAGAHEHGHDRLLRAFAARSLRGKTLKRVLSKWDFLRNDVESVIPLSDEIAARAVALANQFVSKGHHVKGTLRNTMNDMLVAATSQIENIPLLTEDTQLRQFYQTHGWSIIEEHSVFVATPEPQTVDASKEIGPRPESRGYINRPQRLRLTTD